VRFQIVCKRVAAAAFAAFTVFAAAGIAQQKPLTVAAPTTHTYNVAGGNNLYCAGFIQKAPIDTSQSIVGAVEEQEQFMFTERNYVYISAGENKGVKVGDIMTVVRPRGQVKSVWTRKGDPSAVQMASYFLADLAGRVGRMRPCRMGHQRMRGISTTRGSDRNCFR